MFSNWELGDRQRFLEGMYSQFAGIMSQQTYTVSESRGGQHANIFWAPTALFARLAVIDDQIAENELHLLRLVPLSWLRTDREARFEKMPTEFGPVTLRVKLGADGDELQVAFKPQFRVKPAKVILHAPPVQGLKRIVVNGKRARWNKKAGWVDVGRL